MLSSLRKQSSSCFPRVQIKICRQCNEAMKKVVTLDFYETFKKLLAFKYFLLILSPNFLTSFFSNWTSLVLISFGKSPSIGFKPSWFSSGFKAFKASTCFIPWSWIAFFCFSKAFTKGEFVNFLTYLIRRKYFFTYEVFIVINFFRW